MITSVENPVGDIVFDHFDVVRHPLVGKIIEKFENANK